MHSCSSRALLGSISGALLWGILLALVAVPAEGAGQASATVRDTVDATVAAYMSAQRIPGVAVAILEAGRLVKARGYGLADVEHSVPVTAETLFQSGSLGKQFTAAAILLLAEEGRLSLDDPITRHLEDAPVAWVDVTVRHLLNHTSGLGAYGSQVDLREDYTDGELVAVIAALERLFEPGAEWRYSNSGYVLLGIVVSRLTGAHWGRYMAERVFRPAKMETAQSISEADIVPHRASSYRLKDGELKNAGWISPTFLRTGDGTLYFSVLDLVRWDQALRTDAVLSSDSRTAMWTPTELDDGSLVPYGFGWEVYGAPERPHVGHGGSWQAFQTHLLRYEEPAVTVILLSNGAQTDAREIAYAIASAYRPELARPGT